jgi:signal recognition particle subunit SRP54
VKDFEVFHPDRMASRILDMGDILTLIEQAEKAFDRTHAAEMERKFLAAEDFTFDDFLQQMAAIKKMGSLKSMLGMMPGMGQMKRPARRLRRARVRPGRGHGALDDPVRAQPPQADQRLAPGPHRQGVGVQVSEVNQLLERFTEAQKMMKQLARGGGMPGMPGGGSGPGKRGRQQVPQRKKSKSGNPAKRAAEQRAAAERPASGGGAFGAPGAGDPATIDPASLPKGFEKFLGQ